MEPFLFTNENTNGGFDKPLECQIPILRSSDHVCSRSQHGVIPVGGQGRGWSSPCAISSFFSPTGLKSTQKIRVYDLKKNLQEKDDNVKGRKNGMSRPKESV